MIQVEQSLIAQFARSGSHFIINIRCDTHYFMQSLNRVLGSLKHYWLIATGAFISLLLLTAANAITPQLFRWGIDQGIASFDYQVIFEVAGAMVLVAIGRGLFNFLQTFGKKTLPNASPTIYATKFLEKSKILVLVITIKHKLRNY